jgi:hypothetical protein
MNCKRLQKLNVDSPWLTPEESALYCKISLSLFNQKRRELSIKAGGTLRRPRFHKLELDFWMEKGFQQSTGMDQKEKIGNVKGQKLGSKDYGHNPLFLV